MNTFNHSLHCIAASASGAMQSICDRLGHLFGHNDSAKLSRNFLNTASMMKTEGREVYMSNRREYEQRAAVYYVLPPRQHLVQLSLQGDSVPRLLAAGEIR